MLTKLHELILFERADKVSEHHSLRSTTQCGFRKGKGTLDATFTLQHLVARARHCKKRLYVVFVDFEKAFDMVPRSELLERCEGLGIHGPFLDAIKLVYKHVLYQVRCEGVTGPALTSTRGTKQGSHLSPLLFGWFIEQLHDILVAHVRTTIKSINEDTLIQLGEGPNALIVAYILYADDCILISSDPGLMQEMLRWLDRFCDMCGMKVHPGKTKWMEFRNTRVAALSDVQFTYKGAILPRVEACKYMGLWWKDIANIWDSHTPHAKVLGFRVLHGCQARCRAVGITTPASRSDLFHTLVAPSFSHGCQLWSVGEAAKVVRKWHTYSLESLQLMFLRNMAGVGASAHIASLLDEFGHTSLLHSHVKLAARFWNKMRTAAPTSMLHKAWPGGSPWDPPGHG
jgi:hypothetical protein